MRSGDRALVSAVVAVVAVGVCRVAIGGGEAGVAPTASRGEVRLHQLQSTSGRHYTLFEYAVPTANAVPHVLAIDSRDQVWFSESGGRFAKNFLDVPAQSKIGRLDQNGGISEWSLPGEGTSPMGIAFDAHGDLWIAERLANRITRRRSNGRIDHFSLPTTGAWPTGLALDSKGDVWFSETKGDKIGVVKVATGEVVEYPLPATAVMATGLAVGKDDTVWLAERDINVIGAFSPITRKWTQYRLPTPDSKPCGVTVAGDGRVWFTERNGGKLGTITANGTIREYALPDGFGGPFLAVADQRGDIWFSQLFANRIGRFSPADGSFEHFAIPGERGYPAGVAIDSKGNVWFAQQAANRLGVIVRTDLSYVAPTSAPSAPQPSVVRTDGFNLEELAVPAARSLPGIVAVDRNDTVWFTEMGGGFVSPGFPPGPPGSHVGYVRDGVVRELPTPTPASGPTSLGLDPCSDDVWVSLRAANKIARVRDGKIEEFAIPVPDSLPVGIAVDHQHDVWVALSRANKIARRTAGGEWRFLDLPTNDAQPRTVYVDAKDTVWFAEKTGNHIGRIDKKAWTFERWPLPTEIGWPLSLISDRAGNIWFAEMRSDKLGMFDVATQKITEYALPVQSAPFKLFYDPKNDAMWISTVFYDAVLRFDLTTRGVTAAYRTPSRGAWMGGLDGDSKGCLWFSEQFANKIGRLCIDGVAQRVAAVTPAPACRGAR